MAEELEKEVTEAVKKEDGIDYRCIYCGTWDPEFIPRPIKKFKCHSCGRTFLKSKYLKHIAKNPNPNNFILLPPPKSKLPIVIVSIILVAAVIVAIGALIVALNNLTDPIKELKELLEEGNFPEVLPDVETLFKDKIIGDDKQMVDANNVLSDTAKEIVDEYINETKNYDETLLSLESIRGLKGILDDDESILNDEIDGHIQIVNSLCDSRNAYQAAQDYIANQNYESAIIELRKVIKDDKNYSDAQEQLVSSTSSYKNDVYVNVDAYEAANNFDDALTLLEKARALLPNDEDISSRITTCNNKKQEFAEQEIQAQIAEAKQNAEETKNYTEEINKLNLLLTKNPDHAGLQQAIAALKDSHADHIVVQASALSSSDDYRGAINALTAGLSLYPDNTMIAAALDNTKAAHANSIVIEASTLSAEEKFPEALRVLNAGLDLYPSDTSLQNAIATTEKSHAESIIAQADKLAKGKDYEGAIKLLSDNQRIYANYFSDFQTKIDEYTEYLPVYLDTINSLSNIGERCDFITWNTDPNSSDMDNIEKTHEHAIGFVFNYNSYWSARDETRWRKVEYYLNGEYSEFNGQFLIHFDTRNTTGQYQLKISADEKLIYTSPILTTGVLPIEIKELNIKNVNIISFTVSGVGTNNSATTSIAIADAAFSK